MSPLSLVRYSLIMLQLYHISTRRASTTALNGYSLHIYGSRCYVAILPIAVNTGFIMPTISPLRRQGLLLLRYLPLDCA
jgi:hypothetical protein